MDLIKPFLLGGGIIAGAKWLSLRVNPAYAVLLAGAPTGLVTSFFLINDKARHEFYNGYIISTIILSIAISIIYFSIKVVNININYLSVVGYIFWLVLTFLGIKIRLYLKKK